MGDQRFMLFHWAQGMMVYRKEETPTKVSSLQDGIRCHDSNTNCSGQPRVEISANKGCCSYQPLQLPPKVSLEGTQDGKRMPAIRPSDTTATPPWCTLRKLRMRKHRILAPESWGAYQRNDFSEPRLLHLPLRRKALNSFTWDVWFSFINSNLVTFLLPGLCCKHSSISWLLPCLFRAVPQNYLRCCVLGLRPHFRPPTKTTLNF